MVIIIVTATDTSAVVENKKIDENILNKIEEACGRTDINKIV